MRYEIADLQAVEVESLMATEAVRDGSVRVTVTEERDFMGHQRVTVTGNNRALLLAFVRDNWGDDAATGGWFSEHVLPQLPHPLDVAEVAEEASQAAFRVIADAYAVEGVTVTGDVDPGESHRIDQLFRGWVEMMGENEISA